MNDLDDDTKYVHIDDDGDQLVATADNLLGTGAAIHLHTSPAGVSVPLAELPDLIARLQSIADSLRQAA
jgi:hypothetical protein